MGNKIRRTLKKIKIPRGVVLILGFCLMAFVLIKELFSLQIIQGKDYIMKFQTRTTKTRVIKSTRGNIYDREGNVLASNILSYSITLEDNGSYSTTREKNLTLNGIAYRVLKILASNGDALNHNFHITLDEDGNYVFDVSEGFTLNRFRADIYGYALIDNLKDSERTATAEEMVDYLAGDKRFCIVQYGNKAYTSEELKSHGLPAQLTRQEILDIAIVRYLLSTNSFQKYKPVTIATNVSEKSIAAVMENMADLQGIDVVEDSMRIYLDDESLAPILGYTGKASSDELAKLRQSNPDYANDAVVGKSGIEQYMELQLQGTDGSETVTVDNLGKVLKIDTSTQVDPKAGNDVYLTINTDWQNGIYQILKQRVAGILLSKLEADRKFDFDVVRDAAAIMVPIYDVYTALIDNSVVDISKMDDEEASQVERTIYAEFQKKQQEVFVLIKDRLTGGNPPAYRDEEEQVQDYCDYICDTLLRDTLGIIKKDSVDNADTTYLAYHKKGTISLKDYLNYATSQNWIDISRISPEGEYLDSTEVYQALTDYVVDYLKTDTAFSKLLYKYMIHEDRITGSQLCLCLYEQGFLSKEDDYYERLASGAMGSYDFLVNKIWSLEIEPADLALEPCSASCVITDIHTGEVLACVSYPGYDNNRLSNNVDTKYYARLAMDNSSPFFNKATQQQTAPGSTLKLLSTIIGMSEGIIDDNTYINCTGSFDYVEPPINCWNLYGHGPIEIKEAIQESCNFFFNMVGFQAGKNGDNQFSETQSLSVLQRYAGYMGLDRKTGIELSEAAPNVSDAYAVPSYIGQGTHLYTTTQLARYAQTLANSGTVYNLTLLEKVISPVGTVIQSFEPTVINELDVPQNVWDDIHYGMIRVVQTHDQFDYLGVQVAGKTGTAELDIYHPNHGLFIGYAPAYDPQYAIAIRIANGYTSGNACLAAADIFNYIFDLKPKASILTGYASSETSDTSND